MQSVAGALRLIAMASLLLTGCKERKIRAYDAPKDATASRPSMTPPIPSTPETVSWSLPDGWRELPGEGLRFATLIVEGASEDGSRPALELRVTPLGLAARDPLANVNRWRVQIGLGPLEASQLEDVARETEIDARTVHLVNMQGQPGEHHESPHQILAAIVPGDERVWFFMILDHTDRVAKHEAAFEEFVRSVRVHPGQVPDASQMPAGHPPVASADGTPGAPAGGSNADAAAQAAAGVRWTAPEGWHAHPGNSSFRVVSFHVGADPASAEVTITRFTGGAGALLPNINRWRGQIGLAPVATVDEQPLDTLEVGDDKAQLLDIADSESADPSRARMLVVMLPRGDTAWFIKMTGPYEVLEAQRATFVEFARGLRFEVEQS
jgi:hypothetical protein